MKDWLTFKPLESAAYSLVEIHSLRNSKILAALAQFTFQSSIQLENRILFTSSKIDLFKSGSIILSYISTYYKPVAKVFLNEGGGGGER